MTLLDHSLDSIAGGNAQYDAGHAIGGFARSCIDALAAMGNMYVVLY